MDCPNRILASLSSTDGAGQGSDRGRGETLKQARPFVAEHSGANRELSQRPIINRSGRVPLDHWSSGAQGRAAKLAEYQSVSPRWDKHSFHCFPFFFFG